MGKYEKYDLYQLSLEVDGPSFQASAVLRINDCNQSKGSRSAEDSLDETPMASTGRVFPGLTCPISVQGSGIATHAQQKATVRGFTESMAGVHEGFVLDWGPYL